MSFLKSKDEIDLISQSAALLSAVHGIIAKAIAPGVTGRELDRLAEAYIMQHGAAPSFKITTAILPLFVSQPMTQPFMARPMTPPCNSATS